MMPVSFDPQASEWTAGPFERPEVKTQGSLPALNLKRGPKKRVPRWAAGEVESVLHPLTARAPFPELPFFEI
jgi:hypothetical protein